MKRRDRLLGLAVAFGAILTFTALAVRARLTCIKPVIDYRRAISSTTPGHTVGPLMRSNDCLWGSASDA